jgi:hypothetical protein
MRHRNSAPDRLLRRVDEALPEGETTAIAVRAYVGPAPGQSALVGLAGVLGLGAVLLEVLRGARQTASGGTLVIAFTSAGVVLLRDDGPGSDLTIAERWDAPEALTVVERAAMQELELGGTTYSVQGGSDQIYRMLKRGARHRLS